MISKNMARIGGLAAAVCLVAVLSGCDKLQGNAAGPHVIGTGDSLMAAGVAPVYIHNNLDPYYDVEVDAYSGQRIDQILPNFQNDLLADGPIAAVIENFGTNDAVQNYPTALADFNQFVNLTKNVGCVVLTTIALRLDARFNGTQAATLDARIAELHASNPAKYPVVDWDAMSGVPGYFSDGIHESALGAQWFADQYQNALAGCGLGPAVGVTTTTAAPTTTVPVTTTTLPPTTTTTTTVPVTTTVAAANKTVVTQPKR